MHALELHELFRYNPDSGDLVWKYRPRHHFNSDKGWRAFNTRYSGTVAGARNKRKNGDRKSIDVRLGKLASGTHRAHRIIMMMAYGGLSDDIVIDHIDGDPWNNRLNNLRIANYSTNQHNSKLSRGNTSGIKGVTWVKRDQAWAASIMVRGERIALGHHSTKGLAGVARAKAALRYHGSFARIT